MKCRIMTALNIIIYNGSLFNPWFLLFLLRFCWLLLKRGSQTGNLLSKATNHTHAPILINILSSPKFSSSSKMNKQENNSPIDLTRPTDSAGRLTKDWKQLWYCKQPGRTCYFVDRTTLWVHNQNGHVSPEIAEGAKREAAQKAVRRPSCQLKSSEVNATSQVGGP